MCCLGRTSSSYAIVDKSSFLDLISFYVSHVPRRDHHEIHLPHPLEMAKKKGPPSLSRMFPSLHQDVSNAVSEHIPSLRFHEQNTDYGSNKTYSTFVMGEFRCHNNTCPTRAWTSGKVTILIRQYSDGSYNAEVFKQRCRACNRLGTLKMDNNSYVERVSYRLLAWKGVAQVRPHYGSKNTPPHQKHLCEGCKRGICKESSNHGSFQDFD